MGEIIIRYHKESDSLDIWFGNPEDEYICEEVGEGIISKKDKDGNIIGIEKLYVSTPPSSRNYFFLKLNP